jgi:signal transduction histidine kinase
MTRHHIPAPLCDAALIGLAAADALLNVERDYSLALICSSIAALALLLRRRWPHVALVLTLPALAVSNAVIAALIALYSVAAHTRNRRLLAACAVVVGIGYALPWPPPQALLLSRNTILLDLIYAVMFAGAPAFLGLLMQTRHDLALRIREINEARDSERELAAQTVLAKERAQLAREMHDVVSHQVSLIAVQAGALQVHTTDLETKGAARTIRQLSVDTLDELRHMVGLLRASGTVATELAPQPTLCDLERLVANSGIAAELDIDIPAAPGTAAQRAIYRTVQEALTNVRKHAPGATATVRIRRCGTEITTTITNTRPTRPTTPLPSDQHGLIGLRERAELLNGTVECGPTSDGGFLTQLRIPASQA